MLLIQVQVDTAALLDFVRNEAGVTQATIPYDASFGLRTQVMAGSVVGTTPIPAMVLIFSCPGDVGGLPDAGNVHRFLIYPPIYMRVH